MGAQIKKSTWEFAASGRQASVKAGPIMTRSKVLLTLWFMASHVVAFSQRRPSAAPAPAASAG